MRPAHRKSLPLGVLLLIAVCITGCGSNPIAPEVEDQGQPVPIDRDPDENPVDGPDPTSGASSAATESLLAAAEEAAGQQQHESAIVYLERAVRIEPRNPDLWLRLSAQYLASRSLLAAAQHAHKGIALAGDNPELQRRAWLLMADIEQAQGNFSQAQALRRRWGPVRG